MAKPRQLQLVDESAGLSQWLRQTLRTLQAKERGYKRSLEEEGWQPNRRPLDMPTITNTALGHPPASHPSRYKQEHILTTPEQRAEVVAAQVSQPSLEPIPKKSFDTDKIAWMANPPGTYPWLKGL